MWSLAGVHWDPGEQTGDELLSWKRHVLLLLSCHSSSMDPTKPGCIKLKTADLPPGMPLIISSASAVHGKGRAVAAAYLVQTATLELWWNHCCIMPEACHVISVCTNML